LKYVLNVSYKTCHEGRILIRPLTTPFRPTYIRMFGDDRRQDLSLQQTIRLLTT